MRILWITDVIPYPTVSGNRLRIYHLCRKLAEEHEVWLVGGIDKPEEVNAEHMRGFCHRVITVLRKHQSKLYHLPGLLKFALQGRPLELKFEQTEEFEQIVYNLSREVDFDVIHIEPSYMALYREMLPEKKTSCYVLGYHNIEFSLFDRIANVESKPLNKFRSYLHSWMLRSWEPHYASKFDRCVVVSDSDKDILYHANTNLEVRVCPNGVDTDLYQLLPAQDTIPRLMFIGSMSYPACAHGAVWFCKEVLPHIHEPNVETWLVGRDPTEEVKALANDHIHVTGWVSEIMPYYEQTQICIVPLWAGGGTRLKIVEAMALGRPVVSTAIGCEGLDVVDGKHIFIADDPIEFAEKVTRLLQDPLLRRQMVHHARELVAQKYDWTSLTNQLLMIYQEAIGERADA